MPTVLPAAGDLEMMMIVENIEVAAFDVYDAAAARAAHRELTGTDEGFFHDSFAAMAVDDIAADAADEFICDTLEKSYTYELRPDSVRVNVPDGEALEDLVLAALFRFRSDDVARFVWSIRRLYDEAFEAASSFERVVMGSCPPDAPMPLVCAANDGNIVASWRFGAGDAVMVYGRDGVRLTLPDNVIEFDYGPGGRWADVWEALTKLSEGWGTLIELS